MHLHPHPPKLYRRFLGSLSDDNGCLRSTYATTRDGYVLVSFFQGKRYAMSGHRLAWYIEYGHLPGYNNRKVVLDHVCRNRWCCNPAHLELVTSQENNRRGDWGGRTHCKNGHEFTPENTGYADKKRPGRRSCKQCVKERTQAWRAKAKVSA